MYEIPHVACNIMLYKYTRVYRFGERRRQIVRLPYVLQLYLDHRVERECEGPI